MNLASLVGLHRVGTQFMFAILTLPSSQRLWAALPNLQRMAYKFASMRGSECR